MWHADAYKDNLVIRAFYIHGSVHRNSILIRSNKMQQYACIYLLQNYYTLHVSGVHRTHHQENKTITAASGTGHSIL